MGRPQRHWESNKVYFITNRCFQQRYFLRPGEDVNAIILSILASVADKYDDIEIFAFVFMSNHFHMIVRCRSMRISEFMRDWQGQLARELNIHWGRPGGGDVFQGRFKSAPILDDAELLNKLRYTLCNPCESDLVSHPKLWPGLSSWSIHKTGEPLVGERVNRDERRRLKRDEDMSHVEATAQATVEYALEMAKLPVWEDLDDDEYGKKVCQEVCDYAEHLAELRSRPCQGRKKVLEQKWNGRPNNPKKSTCPLCHTTSSELRQEYKKQYRDIVDRYKQAVGEWRKGRATVEFPVGTIPPGHRDVVGTPKPRDRLARN